MKGGSPNLCSKLWHVPVTKSIGQTIACRVLRSIQFAFCRRTEEHFPFKTVAKSPISCGSLPVSLVSTIKWEHQLWNLWPKFLFPYATKFLADFESWRCRSSYAKGACGSTSCKYWVMHSRSLFAKLWRRIHSELPRQFSKRLVENSCKTRWMFSFTSCKIVPWMNISLYLEPIKWILWQIWKPRSLIQSSTATRSHQTSKHFEAAYSSRPFSTEVVHWMKAIQEPYFLNWSTHAAGIALIWLK